MDRIKTNIKERVLQVSKNKGISYEVFFKNLGLSYSNFKGIQKNTSLQSDAIDKIMTIYPDVDLHWLITGKEETIIENCDKTPVAGKNYSLKEFSKLTIDNKLDSIFNELKNIKEDSKCKFGEVYADLALQVEHNLETQLLANRIRLTVSEKDS